MGTYWERTLDHHIVEYNTATDPDLREHLYRTYVDTPLRKLVEILTAKFLAKELLTRRKEIQEEALAHAVLQLPKYHLGRGKSFSYFTVVVRHHIWKYNTQTQKDTQQYLNIRGMEMLTVTQAEDYYTDYQDDTPKTYHKVPYPEELKVYQPEPTMPRITTGLLHYIRTVDTCGGNKPRDREIVFAIRHILNHIHQYDKFNKKALFMDIREQCGYKTEHIHKVILRIQRNYLSQKN